MRDEDVSSGTKKEQFEPSLHNCSKYKFGALEVDLEETKVPKYIYVAAKQMKQKLMQFTTQYQKNCSLHIYIVISH